MAHIHNKPVRSGPSQMEHQEHYEAESKYADMLFVGLEIPVWHLIKRFKAFRAAEKFRDSHRACCEWANEEE